MSWISCVQHITFSITETDLGKCVQIKLILWLTWSHQKKITIHISVIQIIDQIPKINKIVNLYSQLSIFQILTNFMFTFINFVSHKSHYNDGIQKTLYKIFLNLLSINILKLDFTFKEFSSTFPGCFDDSFLHSIYKKAIELFTCASFPLHRHHWEGKIHVIKFECSSF